MDEYHRPYLVLFDGMLDALDALEAKQYDLARETLILAQQMAEKIFIEEMDEPEEECVSEARREDPEEETSRLVKWLGQDLGIWESGEEIS